MAANKFATMLHRNTHKVVVILVYAVLEWILIFLLLLNSFFSFLISQFASYFGLPQPCLLCSRLDHHLLHLASSPSSSASSYTHLVCESHAREISASQYGIKDGENGEHLKIDHVSEGGGAGGDCFSLKEGTEEEEEEEEGEVLKERDSLMELDFVVNAPPSSSSDGHHDRFIEYCLGEDHSLEIIDLNHHNHGRDSGCEFGRLVPVDVIDSSTSAFQAFKYQGLQLENHQNEGLVSEDEDDEEEEDETAAGTENSIGTDQNDGRTAEALNLEETMTDLADSEEIRQVEHQRIAAALTLEETTTDLADSEEIQQVEDQRIAAALTLEEMMTDLADSQEIRQVEHQRIAAALNLEETMADLADSEEIRQVEHQNIAAALNLEETMTDLADSEEIRQVEHQRIAAALNLEETMADLADAEEIRQVEHPRIAAALNLEETTPDLADSEEIRQVEHQTTDDNETVPIEGNIDEQEEAEDRPVQEEGSEDTKMITVRHEPPQTMHELRDLSVNQVQEEPTPVPSLTGVCSSRGNGTETEPANSPDEQSHIAAVSNGLGELHQSFDPINNSVYKSGERGVDVHDHVPACPDPTESWAEESLDGSVRSETESGDPVVTIERLKTTLKSERKSLNALYAELEEERNASAIAANQTMAMINRLQEEKAAMQMEALQYQRMMEEQSEYDQEALQLLNELMVKREKEKQELEKELDVYRKRVLDYNAKEKLRLLRRRRSGNSSATCSNGEEIDELSSTDLNREAKDESGSLSENPESSNDHSSFHHHDDENINLEEIAMDCVKQMTSLDDSLAEFEEERLSILDQLKVLEEKLLNLNDANEVTNDDDVDSARQSLNYSYELSTAEENGGSDEQFKGKDYPERKTMGSMAKSLLPLLDAAEDDETEEGLIGMNDVDEYGVEDSSLCRFDSKQLAIEEEVDHVYERLQALEADREFLKHCMGSIQKGDKGMDLLQEILQHLRDLRSVEVRVRSMSESPLS